MVCSIVSGQKTSGTGHHGVVHREKRATSQTGQSAHRSVSAYAPGTKVSWRTSQQVMVADRTSGSHGTWARYQWTGSQRGWEKVSAGGVEAHFGKHGVTAGSRRVERVT